MRITLATKTTSLALFAMASCLPLGCDSSSESDDTIANVAGMPTSLAGGTSVESAAANGGDTPNTSMAESAGAPAESVGGASAGGANDAASVELVETGLSRQSFDHNGTTREYLLYVPPSYDGSTAVPLLFNLHGNEGSAQDQLDWADMRPQADENVFILVYPQGLSSSEGVPEWNSYVGEDNKSDTDDFGFITALVENLSSTFAIDGTRVYVTGYSNGGFMAHALACFHNDVFAGVASVSGTMMENSIALCMPTHPTAVLVIHGTNDFTVPYNGGSIGFSSVADTLNYWRTYNGTADEAVEASATDGGTTIEHFAYLGGTGDVAVEHYKVNGGDHVWFSETYNGATMNDLVWQFLSRFDTSGARTAN